MLDWLGCEQLHANAKPPVMPMRSGFLCARAPASPPRGSILFQPRLVHHQARAVLVAEHALLQEAVQAAGVEPDQALVWFHARSLDSFLQQCVFCDEEDRKSTRLNSSHQIISYAVFC